jgi:proteasome alpha subunit
VDYARENVRKGATAMGIVVENGVVLIAHKNIVEPLAVPSTVQKIFRVDSFIGVAYSGMISDGMHLIALLRNKAQSHRMVYNETESVEMLTKEIAEEMQAVTQYGGMRPYAISLLVAGIDNSPKLFEIDPSAAYLGYKAEAIGAGKKTAEEILVKSYKDDMSVDDGINLGVGIIKKVQEGKLDENNVDISTVTKNAGFVAFTPEQISKYV